MSSRCRSRRTAPLPGRLRPTGPSVPRRVRPVPYRLPGSTTQLPGFSQADPQRTRLDRMEVDVLARRRFAGKARLVEIVDRRIAPVGQVEALDFKLQVL